MSREKKDNLQNKKKCPARVRSTVLHIVRPSPPPCNNLASGQGVCCLTHYMTRCPFLSCSLFASHVATFRVSSCLACCHPSSYGFLAFPPWEAAGRFLHLLLTGCFLARVWLSLSPSLPSEAAACLVPFFAGAFFVAGFLLLPLLLFLMLVLLLVVPTKMLPLLLLLVLPPHT